MEKRNEVLFNQLRMYRDYLLAVSDVSEEAANVIPSGCNNNIRWNLGHVYLDQYLWIQHLTKEPIELPEGFREWFDYGTSPANFSDDTPDLATLRDLLKIQPKAILEAYGNRLEEEFAPTEAGMHTISQVLVRTIFHEGLHMNAIQSICKFL
ncbi:DinB family protein [Brevibacillus daliensis]|uniref:DinB family protein n=1 Tax=Brevibacillus daliensis TaxID=2892995 RepID=UPI001E335E28|nr:DinB family protein [Brevibacillus daliensis]